MNLSFLKNVSPLRYSDLTDDRDEDKSVALKQNVSVNWKSNNSLKIKLYFHLTTHL